MKKKTGLFAAVLLGALALSACGGTKEVTAVATVASEPAVDETKAEASGMPVSEIYEKIASVLPEMVKVDTEYMSNYYGIEAEDLDEYVFAIAEDPTRADTVIILHAKDEKTAKAVAAQLEVVKQQKAQELENYNPEQYKIVSDSSVETIGTYAYLVISEHEKDIWDVIVRNLG